MNDQHTTPYGAMYKPEADVEVDAPAVPARVFGATAMIDETVLIYDETNSMWVHDNDRDEPWVGIEPTLDPTYIPTPVPTPEFSPDSPETFVSVNLDGYGQMLRLRSADSTEGEIVEMIPNDTVLKVISADNPEWPFVEYANGDGEPLRGYVKGSLVVETPAQ
jgi:hypothetical protein